MTWAFGPHGGVLVILGGEAGGGKTALVRRFCAEPEVGRVLWGACDPLFTPRPLGPFVDIAQELGGDLLDLVQSGARPHQVAAAMARDARATPGTIVVLEDLHWADEATLDVLSLPGPARPVPLLRILALVVVALVRARRGGHRWLDPARLPVRRRARARRVGRREQPAGRARGVSTARRPPGRSDRVAAAAPGRRRPGRAPPEPANPAAMGTARKRSPSS